MTEPIVKTLEVPCDKARAFDVFANQVATWWPLSKNTVSAMSGGVAKSVTIEPRVEGRIYEIGEDGTEHRWEALGDRADQMREGYNNGWVGVFDEAFAAACNAAV